MNWGAAIRNCRVAYSPLCFIALARAVGMLGGTFLRDGRNLASVCNVGLPSNDFFAMSNVASLGGLFAQQSPQVQCCPLCDARKRRIGVCQITARNKIRVRQDGATGQWYRSAGKLAANSRSHIERS